MSDSKDKILDVIELIESGVSERKACETVGIPRSTFRTTALRAGVGDHYARALEALAMDQIEKAEVTIEDMRSGVIDAQQARVELDARKWFASKFLPKRFGDRLELDNKHSGEVVLSAEQAEQLIRARIGRSDI